MVARATPTIRYASILRGAVAACILGIVVCMEQASATVSPETQRRFIARGGQGEFRTDVIGALDETIRVPVDVVLLSDLTGSMRDTISTVRDRAEDTVQSIKQRIPDVRFAVAGYVDHGQRDTQAYVLLTDFVADPAQVVAALRRMTIAGESNKDSPEAIAHALEQVRRLAWRQNAIRYLIIFGDAPPLDPKWASTTRVDVGADGQPLPFDASVEGLASSKIKVVAIYAAQSDKVAAREVEPAFKHLAQKTDGIAVPLKAARDISPTIVDGLAKALRLPSDLVAEPVRASWVEISRRAPLDRSDLVDAFDVVVRVPEDAPWGRHRIPLRASNARGDNLGQGMLIVTTGWVNWPWLLPVVLFVAAMFLLLREIRRRDPVRFVGNARLVGELVSGVPLVVLLIIAGFIVGMHLRSSEKVLSDYLPHHIGRQR